MMLVRALTIESPVITVYRMAPNAAAATVPMAYSTVIPALLMCLVNYPAPECEREKWPYSLHTFVYRLGSVQC